MRKIAVIQVVINCIFIFISILFALGKMLDVKYNIESASNADYGVCSDLLYSFIGQYNILIGIIIVFNILLSSITLIKLRKHN